MSGDRARVATAFVGPIAWAAHLTLGYALAPGVGPKWQLHVLSAVCFAAAAVATLMCWRQWDGRNPPAEGPESSRSFVSLAGIVMNAFFVVVIVAEAIPTFILRPGD
jgi:hypothetical protein